MLCLMSRSVLSVVVFEVNSRLSGVDMALLLIAIVVLIFLRVNASHPIVKGTSLEFSQVVSLMIARVVAKYGTHSIDDLC